MASTRYANFKNRTADFYSNTKNAFKPSRVKSGELQDKKVRVTKYKNYDKKTVTYKVVTFYPMRSID